MNSRRLTAAIVLFLGSVVCATLLSSCWPGEDSKTTKKSPAQEDLLPVRPLFEGWENPAFVLCVTGETHGYLEPCGCSETQSGGLSRRADLFRQLDERKWPRGQLDLGGSLKRSRRQSEIKFEVLLGALQQMDYAALGMGKEELRLDPGYLLSLESENEPALLSANTVLFGIEEGNMPRPEYTFEVAGKTVGVVSVIGDTYRNEIMPPRGEGEASTPEVDVRGPHDAIASSLKKLTANGQPDLLVLLSNAEIEESQKLAKDFPQFNLVISAGGAEDPGQNDKRIGESKTMFATVGQKGKSVGVIGYFPDAEEKLKFELVELDNRRFHDTPEMQEVMRRYQERLRDERVVQNMQPVSHQWGARFVGAEKCGECHKKAFNKWKTTGHARAYDSLSKGREGQEENWVSRIHDPECLACHVTGWNPEQIYPYESGFIDVASTPLLQGQQCENCHGPGSIHSDLEWERKQGNRGPQDEEMIEWRKKLHLDQAVAKERVCIRCHDLDNSPKFEFDEYWKKVAHPGRD